MKTVIVALPGSRELGDGLGARLQCTVAAVEAHCFPDGEHPVRLGRGVEGCRVVLAAHLDHPDDKTLPRLFAADAARELGAREVGLVAPYLPYMRQDARFRPGEAVTSRSYARPLSSALDFLVTVDPHLHRWKTLDEIYPIRTSVVAAAPAIGEWLLRELPNCIRSGDREVRVHLPQSCGPQGRTPVLLDDIISTGHTIAAAAQELRTAGWNAPVVVAVHALVADKDLAALHRAGVARIVSCDTITHQSNAISVRGAAR